MSTNIDKNSIKFIFGAKCCDALSDFLSRHPHATGFALLGRSNVGKSTLINALFGRKAAHTSQTPGRTRQINAFTFQLKGSPLTHLLFDLPGYGFAKVSKGEQRNWRMLMDTFFSHIDGRPALICLQDARHPDQKSDRELYRYLESVPLDSFLVLNKIDKIKTQREKSVLNKSWRGILSRNKEFKNIFQVSALKKTGIEELENALGTYILDQNQTSF